MDGVVGMVVVVVDGDTVTIAIMVVEGVEGGVVVVVIVVVIEDNMDLGTMVILQIYGIMITIVGIRIMNGITTTTTTTTIDPVPAEMVDKDLLHGDIHNKSAVTKTTTNGPLPLPLRYHQQRHRQLLLLPPI